MPANWPQLILEGGFATTTPVQPSGVLILDDAVNGKLNTGTLAADVTWSDLSQWVRSGSITRPATRQRGPLWSYQAGTAAVALNNEDGRFDPDNLAGPYVAAGASELTAMTPVRLRAMWAATTYPLYQGYADSWDDDGRNYAGRYAETALAATDAQKVLTGIAIPTTGAAGAGETTGARVNRILTAAGWYTGTGQAQVATGDSTVQSTTFGDTAWNLMQAASDAEIGELYLDGSGVLTFRDRHAILTDDRSAIPQAIFGDSPGTLHWVPQSPPVGVPYPVAAVVQNASTSLAQFVNATGAGDAIVVAACATAGAPTGVTDTKGNAYAQAATFTANGMTVTVYVALAATALTGSLTDQVTVTFSSGAGANSWTAAGCPGITGSMALDVTVSGSGSSAAPSLASGALSQPTELVVAILANAGGTGNLPSWAAGWTAASAVATGATANLSIAAQAVSSAGSVTASASITSAAWDMIIISLRGNGLYLAELPYTTLARARDDTTLANDVQATRVGGALQEAQDAASIAKYLFPRSYSNSSLILQADATALSWAQWVLYVAKDDDDRFDSLVISPLRDPVNLWPQALGRQAGDRIQVWRRPPNVAPVVKDCFIRGIAHAWDWGAGTWATTWMLQDASKYGSFLVLDDPVLGVLGSNALAF